MDTTELIQKIYELIQIAQTFALLIQEIQALCVRSFLRWLFGIVSYYIPQLNPYRLIDAYKIAAEAIRNKQMNEARAAGNNPETDAAKPVLSVPEEPGKGNRTPINDLSELPNVCECP